MSILSTKEHEAFRQEVRAFAEKEIKPMAAQLDENETFSVELSRKMGQAGLYGIDIPKEHGGQGKDTLSYIIAVEELARVDSSQAATMAAHNSLGLAPVYHFGTEEQRQKYVPLLTSGEGLWAFGLTEVMAGSDAQGVETTSEDKGDHWLINGSKRYITNGSNELMKGITVLAVTNEEDGKKRFSTILVDRDSEGFETKRIFGKMMWRASDTAELKFSNIKVNKDQLLGKKDKGLGQMLKTLDSGRLSIAAMGLGLAQGAYEMALEYAQKREQFGQTIASNQVIAFKLADMALKLELARNTLYNACALKDAGQPFGKEAAMAKLYCSDIAKEIADEAVQIFSGQGLLKSSAIERFYRDQRILQIGEGTSEILRIVISKHLGLV
ncbi:acyl-CoA dehydrogenase family protein [Carboxylicivirga mesophila]|uniref:Acyl-CoA dehydrogenase family protein n=1 Tax=Carboxylicivirga mesophila TaxID=1166478 RepID=A0ABS5KBB8_9BACT|nr:acyl-CoA dehydrogenase family protein [Carboxylicivirga mesophila]MBS2211823.1 acyl-CoA dehydrogenase family protein [Carboxylicivirga mesophila]